MADFFIADAIHKSGFLAAFAVPGVPITEALTALRLQGKVLVSIHRNEQQAVNAAAGFAYMAGTYALESYYPQVESLLQTCGLPINEDLQTILNDNSVQGSPALAISTSGPAFMNALGGIMTAHANSWPLVLLASSSGNINDNYFTNFQEYPQYDVASKLVHERIFKCALRVQEVGQLYPSLLKARFISLSGQPGPVYVDVDRAVWRLTCPQTIQTARDKMESFPEAPMPVPRVPVDTVEHMLHAFIESERPLFIFGKGLAYSAGPPITWLLDQLRYLFPVPVLTTPMGKGIINDDDPRNAGGCRSFALKESDCVFAFGARLNWMFSSPQDWMQDKKHIFTLSLSDNLPLDLAERCENVAGDATIGLLKLIAGIAQTLKTVDVNTESRQRWLHIVQQKSQTAKEKLAAADAELSNLPPTFEEESRRWHGGLSYAAVLRTLASETLAVTAGKNIPLRFRIWLGPGNRAAVDWVAEGAVSMDRSRLYLPSTVAKGRMDAATTGTMGIGTPFAIAISIWRLLFFKWFKCDFENDKDYEESMLTYALDHSFVCLVQGDSAFGFSGLEFETVFRYKLPILTVVLDNGGMYAMSDEPAEHTRRPASPDTAVERLHHTSVTDLTPHFEFQHLALACGGSGCKLLSVNSYIVSARQPLHTHDRAERSEAALAPE